MVRPIKIEMMGKIVKLDLSSNILTSSTVKSNFLLSRDAIVSLSYEDDEGKKGCEMNENGTAFLLPNGCPNMESHVESDQVPSRPSTSFDSEGPNQKKQKLEPNPEQLPIDGDLAAYVGRFALYYNVKGDNYKRCAVPLTPRLAATFRHGENKDSEGEAEWNE